MKDLNHVNRFVLARQASKLARLTLNTADDKRPPIATHVKKAIADARRFGGGQDQK